MENEKSLRWTNKSERAPENYRLYGMIKKAIVNDIESIENINQICDQVQPYWEQHMRRRDTLGLFASSRPKRNMIDTMEKVWFQNLFDTGGYNPFPCIKRIRRVQIVETRTDFFVVVPTDRKVVV